MYGRCHRCTKKRQLLALKSQLMSLPCNWNNLTVYDDLYQIFFSIFFFLNINAKLKKWLHNVFPNPKTSIVYNKGIFVYSNT
jgi:hypothetical protein